MKSFTEFYNAFILNENVINEVPRSILGMETTYENFPMEEPYGFWVDRSGNWIVVNYQDHLGVAESIIDISNQYLNSVGKPTIDLWGNSSYGILFQAGFMRVTTATYNKYYELYKPSDKVSPAQQKFLSMCRDMWGDEIENANAC